MTNEKSEIRCGKSVLKIFPTAEALAAAVAEKFIAYATETATSNGRFATSLAGGKTPRRVYELLATAQHKNRVEWSRVHLFFGDERCVPPNHPESNYRMAYEAFISRIPIPDNNVHRIKGELEPIESAREYEQELRSFFKDAAWPRCDLVLLGMGEDGHTASLFPHSDALKERSRFVVATRQEQSGQNRITLTLPVFNHAAHVAFLVTGTEKAARLKELLQNPSPAEKIPASLIQPLDGTLEWFADQAAAALL